MQASLDFGPNSVIVTVKDLVQEIISSTEKNLLAAWSWLIQQRQDFFSNHLARFPITPNHQGTLEMRDDVVSNVGVQELRGGHTWVSGV